MQKIVINKCYGGFGLSEAALDLYKLKKGLPATAEVYYWEIGRDDQALVETVEELGDEANDAFSRLVVVEVQDEVQWTIMDYDGMEHIAKVHRTWW